MQAHRSLYSSNRPLRVAAATDIHRRCCQNCCQTSKLLSNLRASGEAKLLGSGPRLGRPADARNSSIATFIWTNVAVPADLAGREWRGLRRAHVPQIARAIKLPL